MGPYVWVLCLQVQLSENVNCSEKKICVCADNTQAFKNHYFLNNGMEQLLTQHLCFIRYCE